MHKQHESSATCSSDEPSAGNATPGLRTARLRRGKLSRAVLALLLGLSASCIADSPERRAAFGGQWLELAALAPGTLAELESSLVTLADGDPAPAGNSGGERKHASVHATLAGSRVDALLSDDARDAIELRDSRGDIVRRRRIGATDTRARYEKHFVAYENAFADVDAVVHATARGLEELLRVRSSNALISYELEIPQGWSLAQPPSSRWLVEVRDESGIPRQRFRTDRAWDASGRPASVELSLKGTRVDIMLRGPMALPVLVGAEWQSTESMAVTRSMHTSMLLPNGKVLILGGSRPTSLIESFDPAAGTFAVVATLALPRSAPAAVLLRDGRVLIAGGNKTETQSELFDYRTNSVSAGPNLSVPREQLIGVSLPTGDALFVDDCNRSLCTDSSNRAWGEYPFPPDELFVAETNEFRRVPADGGVAAHSAAIAFIDSGEAVLLSPAEKTTFDPVSKSFGSIEVASNPALLWQGRARLPAGRLLTGTDIQDWRTGTTERLWRSTRQQPYPSNLVVHSSGDVLANSGTGEIDVPFGSGSHVLGARVEQRAGAAATLLPSGSVLLSGGDAMLESSEGQALADAVVIDAGDQRVTGTGALALSMDVHSSAHALNRDLVLTGTVRGLRGRDEGSAQLLDARTLQSHSLPWRGGERPSAVSLESPGREVLYLEPQDPHAPSATPRGHLFLPARQRFVTFDVPGGNNQPAIAAPMGPHRYLVVPIASSSTDERPAMVFDARSLSFQSSSGVPNTTGLRHAEHLGDGTLLLRSEPDRVAIFDPSSGISRVGSSLLANAKLFRLSADRFLAMGAGAPSIYDPSSEVRLPCEKPTSDYDTWGPQSIVLSSGELLFVNVGGAGSSLAAPELFDPVTRKFRSSGLRDVTHLYSTLERVNDDRVLGIASTDDLRDDQSGVLTNRIDIFGSKADTVERLSAPVRKRIEPMIHSLSTGEILIAGGFSSAEATAPASVFADIYDPVTNSSQPLRDLPSGRAGATAAMLDVNRILFIGGEGSRQQPTRSTLLFDAIRAGFIAGPSMQEPRTRHSSVRLSNGEFLVTGGTNGQATLASAEIYDPAREEFRPVSPMKFARSGHTSVLLDSGKVLIAGGDGSRGQVTPTELYDPKTHDFTSLAGGYIDSSVSGVPLPGGGVILASSDGLRVRSGSATGERLLQSDAGFEIPAYLPGGAVALAGFRKLAMFDTATRSVTARTTSNIEWQPSAVLTRAGSLLVASNEAHMVPTSSPGVNELAPLSELRFAEWSMTASDAVRPVLHPGPAQISTTVPFDLTGERFTRMSCAGSEREAPDPAIVPNLVFLPVSGGYPIWATISSWSDTGLRASFPRTAHLGPGWLFVIVESVPSMGQFATLKGSPQSAACLVDSECASGTCADGFCCDRQCHDGCEACSAALQSDSDQRDGVCLPAKADTNPHGTCSDDGTQGCGRTGVCDGTHPYCAVRLDGSECANGGKCRSGTCSIRTSHCDVSGEKLIDDELGESSCDGYRCDRNACLKECASTLDCAHGFYCTANARCEREPGKQGGTLGCSLSPLGSTSGTGGGTLLLASVATLLRRRRRRRGTPFV